MALLGLRNFGVKAGGNTEPDFIVRHISRDNASGTYHTIVTDPNAGQYDGGGANPAILAYGYTGFFFVPVQIAKNFAR